MTLEQMRFVFPDEPEATDGRITTTTVEVTDDADFPWYITIGHDGAAVLYDSRWDVRGGGKPG